MRVCVCVSPCALGVYGAGLRVWGSPKLPIVSIVVPFFWLTKIYIIGS